MNGNGLAQWVAGLNDAAPKSITGQSTTGQLSNCIDHYRPYDFYGSAYQQWPYVYVNTLPVTCSADLHVFACEHATACRCGKAHRKPEPKKCGACGK